MKKLLMLFSVFILATSCAGRRDQDTNYSDPVDANNVPASLEQREEEFVNTSDEYDLNATPAPLEQREEEEQLEFDEQLEDDSYWE